MQKLFILWITNAVPYSHNSICYQRINYDATKKSNYSFQLQVRDSSGLQAQTTVVIQITDINDNPPVFAETPKNVTLAENVDPGTLVTTFTASDIDSGDNGKFSLAKF